MTYTHYAPPPLEHDVRTMTIDNNMHMASFKHHEELNNDTLQAEPDHYTVIELAIPNNGCGDWANEIEEGMGYTLQYEYTAPNYSAPPAPPSPVPWYPPPRYNKIQPHTHYTPLHNVAIFLSQFLYHGK
jgi:hypothetical protein